MKPITAYLEAEEDHKEKTCVDQGGQGEGEQMPLSLTTFRNIRVQESGKIEVEFQHFKDEVC